MEPRGINNTDIKIDDITLQKMVLIMNALNSGWSVKKKNESYIFHKNHKGEKEIYLDSYLNNFLEENLDIEKILE
jgi:hypothetical protein